MSGAPVVVKLGGRALEAPGAAAECAAALTGIAAPCVVVHGGGAEVSDWCRRLGIEPRFDDGLRVTDAATLEVATAVLAGLANKRLVAALRHAGLDAVGLSALDGGLVTVAPHPDAGRLGAVGAVRGVARAWLHELLAAGRCPVLASLGAADGALLNLNADDVAAAVAAALPAALLVLLSDTPGLRRGGALVAEMAAGEVAVALAGPDVTGGMRPKLRAAARALAGGVAEVRIAAWEGPGTLDDLVAGRAGGTRIVAADATPAPEVAHG